MTTCSGDKSKDSEDVGSRKGIRSRASRVDEQCGCFNTMQEYASSSEFEEIEKYMQLHQEFCSKKQQGRDWFHNSQYRLSSNHETLLALGGLTDWKHSSCGTKIARLSAAHLLQ